MKYLLTSILVVISLVGHTQTHLVSNPQKILYLGYENPVFLSVDDLDPSEYTLKTSNGSVIQKQGYWFVEPSRHGETVLSVLSLEDSSILYRDTVQSLRFPDPSIYFEDVSNIRKQSFTAEQFSQFSSIEAGSPNLSIPNLYRIVSLQVTIRSNDSLTTFNNIGQSLNEEIRHAFSRLEPRDRVWLDNVRVECIDRTTRTVGKLFFVPPLVETYHRRQSEQRESWLRDSFPNYDFRIIDGSVLEGEKTGKWVYYDMDSLSLPRVEGIYDAGKLIKVTEYYANNQPKKEYNLSNDGLTGPFLRYYRSGQLKVIGNYTIYTVSIDTLYDPTPHHPGITIIKNIKEVKDGNWKHFSESGKLIRQRWYNNGKLIREEEY